MSEIKNVNKPTKREQQVAIKSYPALEEVLKHLGTEEPEIEIEETKDQIKIPLKALKLLNQILKAMSKGQSISIIPTATELSTQKAAEILGCSRPFLVELLEEGNIPFTKVGTHRRVKMEDIIVFKQKQKKKQKQHLIEMMQNDEELGLYDS